MHLLLTVDRVLNPKMQQHHLDGEVYMFEEITSSSWPVEVGALLSMPEYSRCTLHHKPLITLDLDLTVTIIVDSL